MRISDWSSDVCSSDLVDDETYNGLTTMLHRRAKWLRIPAELGKAVDPIGLADDRESGNAPAEAEFDDAAIDDAGRQARGSRLAPRRADEDARTIANRVGPPPAVQGEPREDLDHQRPEESRGGT